MGERRETDNICRCGHKRSSHSRASGTCETRGCSCERYRRDTTNIPALVKSAKREHDELGGWPALKSGDWLWRLIQQSFRDYWERATVEYFEKKYGSTEPDKIARTLITVAAKNAAILGGITGAAVSTDEIAAILTGPWLSRLAGRSRMRQASLA